MAKASAPHAGGPEGSQPAALQAGDAPTSGREEPKV